MRSIHQTLLSEKELHEAILKFLADRIDLASIDDMEILCEGRILRDSYRDAVRIHFKTE
jgi:hypothetical protein